MGEELTRRETLSSAALLAISGCSASTPAVEGDGSSVLVIESDEQHTITDTESYSGVEMHAGGTLELADSSTLKLTQQ